MKKFVFAALVVLLATAGSTAQNQPQGTAALVAAFEAGQSARIIEMLTADPKLLSADLDRGFTALHMAAYYGLGPVVDFALKNGADPEAKERRGLTPVWFSVSGNHPGVLRQLIARKVNLGIKNQMGDGLLHRAAQGGLLEVFGILLQQGLKLDERDLQMATPLAIALNRDDAAILKLLADNGYDLKALSDPAFSLLHYGAMAGVRVIHYLLDNGWEINPKDQAEGRTPLYLAVDVGNRDGARALVMRGADPNIADVNGISAFMHAVKKGDRELADMFLKKGADAAVIDPKTGRTPLHEAAARGNSPMINTLLAAGSPKNAADKAGDTALSLALKHGNRAAADLLRKNGADGGPAIPDYDEAAVLSRPLKNGEATIWYLSHSGWAVKTKSALLIFDYWENDPAPDEKLLANGHIRPEELKGIPAYVFVSHEHADHFNPQILEWKKARPDITLIFGFEPQNKEGLEILAPRVQKQIGPLTVTTIRSNDLGVGFAVQVDGLTLFHAGDHANPSLETAGNVFFPEIDFLAEKGIKPDIAFFLNMYGCGSTNPEAFQKGIFYAVDKLKIKSVLPMHGANREWVYRDLADAVAKNKINVQVGVAVDQGDRFSFRKGVLAK